MGKGKRMITFAVIVFWLGVLVSAAAIVGAATARRGLWFASHIFKRAVRAWMRGRANAGSSAGRRVGRTARPNLAAALIETRAMRRVA